MLEERKKRRSKRRRREEEKEEDEEKEEEEKVEEEEGEEECMSGCVGVCSMTGERTNSAVKNDNRSTQTLPINLKLFCLSSKS